MDFHLSRDYYLRAHITFTRVNKIEAIYQVLPVNAKVERELLRLHVTHVTFCTFYLRSQKIRNSDPPYKSC